MAHFAKLNDKGVVLEVIVVSNDVIENLPFPESEPLGVEFLTSWSRGHTKWKQTSYNGSFRKAYAGAGFTYDADKDAFIPPQPYPSWTLNPETCQWEAPTPYPNNQFYWHEATQTWVPTPITES